MSNPDTFTSAELNRIRRNRWVLALAALPLLPVAGVLAFFAYMGVADFNPYASALDNLIILSPFAIQPIALGMAVLACAYRMNPWFLVQKTVIHADRKGIRIGAKDIPRSMIRRGFFVPARKKLPLRVILDLRRRLSVEIQVCNVAEGRRLLGALGLDASQTVTTFKLLSRAPGTRRHGVMAALWGASTIAGFIFLLTRLEGQPVTVTIAVLSWAFITVAMLIPWPTRVAIGADGIALTRLRGKRFIGYGELTSVSRGTQRISWYKADSLSLLLVGGQAINLAIAWEGAFDGATQIEIIEQRLREAMEAYHRGSADSATALLQRRGRPVADWIVALRSIGSGANADARTAIVPRDHLFRVAEDPKAPPLARAAAAVALGAELDDDGRSRLRVAAEGTAAPRLRIAIEKAAAGPPDAAMEAALAELDAEGHESPRSRSRSGS